MINDGYNAFVKLNLGGSVVRVVYRPMLSHERLALFEYLAFLDSDALGDELFADEIHNRVLNWEDVPADLGMEDRSRLWDAVCGRNPRTTEEEDAKNLALGVRLRSEYPNLPSCEQCQKWQMDPLTGQYHKRGGKPQLRLPDDELLCRIKTNTGESLCPQGTPENPKGLSQKNERALRHYLECRAVGWFPDDAIVRNNARIISNELKNGDRRFSFSV